MNLVSSMILASQEIIDAVDEAWWMLTIISLVLMIGIMGTLVFFLVKYHRSRHPDPSKIAGNTKLEITWTVLPTILAGWLFFIGYDGFEKMRDVPEGATEIECIGRQWFWEFRYPEYNISSPDLVVPVGTPIRVNVTAPADDVLHSFFIPHFRVKEDCVPGSWGYVWFEADKISEYNIFCTEFCGKDHSRMLAKLKVLSQKDYESWLDEEMQKRYLPVDAAGAMDPQSDAVLARKGPILFKTYCVSCHGERGEGGLVEGARNFQDVTPKNWKNGPKETDIYRTLEKGIPDTQMKSFNNLAPWDRIALAHHVASFCPEPDRPHATKAEWEKLIKELKLDEPPEVSRKWLIKEAIDEMVGKADDEEPDGKKPGGN